MAKLAVEFTNETAVTVNVAPLHKHLEQILDRLSDKRDLSVELTIASKDKVQKLNKEFLNHDYATDVLSFPAPEGIEDSKVKMLGSIIICEPVARTQAADAGIGLEDELKYLAGHSLLHLLGYHHN